MSANIIKKPLNLKKSVTAFLRRRLFVVAVLSAAVLSAVAAVPAGISVSGIIRDSLTTEGLPYATVIVEGTGKAVVADSRGIFEAEVPADARLLVASYTGYCKKTVPIPRPSLNIYDIYLSPERTQLDEVVVTKSKYSKKNNPAVDFAERLRRTRHLADPRLRHPYYSYDKYERISVGLNDFDTVPARNALLRRWPFLIEHVDTSEVSGKPVLKVSLKERASRVSHRRSPQSEKEIVRAFRSEGIDEIAGQENVQKVLNDVLREVDLYDDDIAILRNRFVSPLSRIAPDFYRFYLVDTVATDEGRFVVLSFYPRNKASFGFNGSVYVAEGDTSMFIRKIEMRVPRDINLNFVDKLMISQSYDRAPDGTRLKTSDDMEMELSLIPGTQGAYIRRLVEYSDHSFDAPADTSIFDIAGNERVLDTAEDRDSAFWQEARGSELTKGESRTDVLADRLRETPFYFWSERILKTLINGYVGTRREGSRFDFGPVLSFVGHDELEGWRVKVGGMTTASLSKQIFGRGYVAYGFSDRKVKYGAEAEYSFADKKHHSREFPVHSLRLTHNYDVDHLGQHLLYTDEDNIIFALKRLDIARDTYRRLTELRYTLELRNNFSLEATVSNVRQEATRLVAFVDGKGRAFSHYTRTGFGIKLRYAPGEKFSQGRTRRRPINHDAPIFILSHEYSPRGLFGAPFEINKTEASAEKRFWLSAFGYIDTWVGGGYVWSKSPFPDLMIPNANLSYTIQKRSFALMNPMEFVNSAYVAWDITYWLNGAILNYIPWVKKLKLREVAGFRGVYGSLSRRCTPGDGNPSLFAFPEGAAARSMDRGPYMEVSVGLDNILRLIRLEYVWRLSYLDVPYKIDRRGLRVGLHLTF